METAVGVLIVALLGCVYLAAILATLDGTVRAIRERYLPPWVVGVATAVLLCALYTALDASFGRGGGFFAIPCGIVAGAVYGLRRRALQV
jgi:phosphotransferase system  glucose/maltose/N-acetylglucosamine-specific IIC component